MQADGTHAKPRRTSKATDINANSSKPKQRRRPAAAITKSPPPQNNPLSPRSSKSETTTTTRRKPKRRNKAFANIASSGYGTSSYQPKLGARIKSSESEATPSMTVSSTSPSPDSTRQSSKSTTRSQKTSDATRAYMTRPRRKATRVVSPL